MCSPATTLPPCVTRGEGRRRACKKEERGGGSTARGGHDAGARARGSEGRGLEGAKGGSQLSACARKRGVGAGGREGGSMKPCAHDAFACARKREIHPPVSTTRLAVSSPLFAKRPD